MPSNCSLGGGRDIADSNLHRDKDITALVDFGNSDDEALPITKCACGARFDAWDFIISIYRYDPHECPHCHRKLYFRNSIRVYEVVGE